MTNEPATTFAVALAAGMIAQVLAVYLRIPGIVILLVMGVLLGPDLIGIVQPNQLGEGLDVLVELAVAIILFEGAMSLNVERIRGEAKTIQRLITLGALVTAAGGALAARAFIGWPWSTSILFGTLVIVTGPTVVTPLLRRMRVNRNLHTILEAEGVFIDPIGAIVAVVALEVVITSAAVGLVDIPARLLGGAAVGAAGGFLIGTLLRRNWLPVELENVFTLSMVVALFELSNVIIPESGIANPVAAGLVVGNMTGRRELREFKEQLTVILIGLIFVLLAADVRLQQLQELGWAALLVVFALMFLVRPIGVALSTAGSALSWREKAFISWIGPRGIVAAAIASLFAVRMEAAGLQNGADLRALVFSVIALTVVIQGLTGGWIAGLLGVSRSGASGYVIIGANALAREIARALSSDDQEVVLIDSNRAEINKAKEQGLTVVPGNAHEHQIMEQADLEGRRGILTLTTNDSVNLLLARKGREEYKVPAAYAALHRGKDGVGIEQVQSVRAALLFGRPVDLHYWNRALEAGEAHVEDLRYDGEQPIAMEEILASDLPAQEDLLPLTVTRSGVVRPMAENVKILAGDTVTFACIGALCEPNLQKLGERDWKRTGSSVEASHR